MVPDVPIGAALPLEDGRGGHIRFEDSARVAAELLNQAPALIHMKPAESWWAITTIPTTRQLWKC